VAEVADYHPLASMQIIMEFGQDIGTWMKLVEKW
jgi:hypothetical protein